METTLTTALTTHGRRDDAHDNHAPDAHRPHDGHDDHILAGLVDKGMQGGSLRPRVGSCDAWGPAMRMPVHREAPPKGGT